MRNLRFAMVVLAAGLIAVLPASAAAKPKAKTKIDVVTQLFVVPSAGDDEADASPVCTGSTTLLSGGVIANTPEPVPTPFLPTEIFRSGPVGTAWFVRVQNDSTVDLQPTAQAICIKEKLKVTGLGGAGKSAASAAAKATSKVTQVNTPVTLPPNTDPATAGHAQFDVPCPKGTKVAGGGGGFSSAASDIQLQESGPSLDNGWHVRYDNDEGTAQSATVSAMCLKSKLKIQGENDKAKSKFEQVDTTVTLPAGATNSGRARFIVNCPKGTTPVGGGGKFDPAQPLATADFQLEESGLVGNGWQVTFDNDETIAQTATVHALCLKEKLKVS